MTPDPKDDVSVQFPFPSSHSLSLLVGHCLSFLIGHRLSFHIGLSALPPPFPGVSADAAQSILVEEDRVVCIRFGHDYDPECMAMDETLYGVTEKVQNFAIIYLGESMGSTRLGTSCSVSVPVSVTRARARAMAILVPPLTSDDRLVLILAQWTSPRSQTSTRCTSSTTLAPSCSSTGELGFVGLLRRAWYGATRLGFSSPASSGVFVLASFP